MNMFKQKEQNLRESETILKAPPLHHSIIFQKPWKQNCWNRLFCMRHLCQRNRSFHLH